MEHVVIIGNGVSGITAARHIRKLSQKKITVISEETPYFFSRTALMYVYMGHMKFEHTQPYENNFWKKNKIELLQARVTEIYFDKNQLQLSNNSSVDYDYLILALGSKPNKFGWPGQNLKAVQGLYSYQDLMSLEKWAPNNKECNQAVVVGGGLIGIELAEMLLSRNIKVTFLVRESSFWNAVLPKGESQMINEHILNHHIDLRLGVNLKEILSDPDGKAKSIIIQETGEEIQCQFVGLTAGVSPNVQFLKDSKLNVGRGIHVNSYLETNIKNVYAIGDCAEQHTPIGNRRSVETVWYTGRMMGETVAQTICNNPTPYKPGQWFNSAKFLDIEYQTYGWVHSDLNSPEYEEHFHWKHPNKDICVTMATHKETGKFLGINTFGIRMIHSIFDQWLTQKKSSDFVIAHLNQALFDPEFYTDYTAQIQSSYQKQALKT